MFYIYNNVVQSYKINCKYEKDEHYIFAEIVEEVWKKVVCYCFYKIFSKKNNKTRQNIFLFKIILLPLQTLS